MIDPSAPRPGLRGDLRELRATLLVVGALIAVLGIAIIIGVVVRDLGGTGDVAVTEVEYHITMPTNLHAGRHTFTVLPSHYGLGMRVDVAVTS